MIGWEIQGKQRKRREMTTDGYLIFFGLQSVRELVKSALVVDHIEIPVERDECRVRLGKKLGKSV